MNPDDIVVSLLNKNQIITVPKNYQDLISNIEDTYGQFISQSSIDLVVKNLNVIPYIYVSYQVYQEISDYWNGKSGAECCYNLIKLASSNAASSAGGTAAVALASFLFPGLGTLVLWGISAVGGIAASMAANKLLDVLAAK